MGERSLRRGKAALPGSCWNRNGEVQDQNGKVQEDTRLQGLPSGKKSKEIRQEAQRQERPKTPSERLHAFQCEQPKGSHRRGWFSLECDPHRQKAWPEMGKGE